MWGWGLVARVAACLVLGLTVPRRPQRAALVVRRVAGSAVVLARVVRVLAQGVLAQPVQVQGVARGRAASIKRPA